MEPQRAYGGGDARTSLWAAHLQKPKSAVSLNQADETGGDTGEASLFLAAFSVPEENHIVLRDAARFSQLLECRNYNTPCRTIAEISACDACSNGSTFPGIPGVGKPMSDALRQDESLSAFVRADYVLFDDGGNDAFRISETLHRATLCWRSIQNVDIGRPASRASALFAAVRCRAII
jgi:hypothetical protein